MNLRISMNPSFDLHAAGLPVDEADGLWAAWNVAIERIAAALNVTITTKRGDDGYDTATMLDDGDVLETLIWQLAHDMCHRVSGVWAASSIWGCVRVHRLRHQHQWTTMDVPPERIDALRRHTDAWRSGC